MNAVTQKALLNPFLQAAVVFTLTGMAMVRKPAAAWTIALVGATFFSMAAPLLMALGRHWFRRLYRANMAVIIFWAATMLFALLLAPFPSNTPPPFLLGGMAYIYAIVLSAALRILFSIISRFIPGPTSVKAEIANDSAGKSVQ